MSGEKDASAWAIIPLPLDSKGISYAFWAYDRGAGKRIMHSIVLAVPSELEQLFIDKGPLLLANLTNWANEFINSGKINKKEIITMVNSLYQSGKSLTSKKKIETKKIALVDEMGKHKEVISKVYAIRGHIPSIVLHPNFPSKITQRIMKRLNGEKSVSDICNIINEEQSKVSHNLKKLMECHFLDVKRKGKKRIYSLNKNTISPILKLVEEHVRKCCKGVCSKK
ncbi:MAG: ArsR/SmtB family transcription factor [Promethearchaeota archaeon]